jgi:dolichyl-phosphate beta-glucosyltransferase
MLSDRPKTGIVVPCYNEAIRFSPSDFSSFMSNHADIYFVFVNDGSRDNTGKILDDFAGSLSGQALTLHLEKNCGKAEAVRQGMHRLLAGNDFSLAGYWDADLATPLSEIPRMIKLFTSIPSLQFAAGSRFRRMGADITRHWYRHYIGRIFATIASIILRLPVYDTQCGAKLFKTKLAANIFQEPFLTKWLFDVEIFSRATQIIGKNQVKNAICEMPLYKWEDKEGSKINLWHYFLAVYELFKIAKSRN